MIPLEMILSNVSSFYSYLYLTELRERDNAHGAKLHTCLKSRSSFSDRN